jgi:methylaspartate mutase sigma subunit
MNPPTIVLGVIGSDCHSVGNQILDAFFTEHGYRVVNLGVMVSQQEFLDAAAAHGAAVVMVSSLYGHAEIDCAGLCERFAERGLKDVLLYVGGNLVVGKTPHEAIERKFLDMGFHRVFFPSDSLEQVAECLHRDLAERRPVGNALRGVPCAEDGPLSFATERHGGRSLQS